MPTQKANVKMSSWGWTTKSHTPWKCLWIPNFSQRTKRSGSVRAPNVGSWHSCREFRSHTHWMRLRIPNSETCGAFSIWHIRMCSEFGIQRRIQWVWLPNSRHECHEPIFGAFSISHIRMCSEFGIRRRIQWVWLQHSRNVTNPHSEHSPYLTSEYRLFYRAFLQKSLMILRSLLIVATQYPIDSVIVSKFRAFSDSEYVPCAQKWICEIGPQTARLDTTYSLHMSPNSECILYIHTERILMQNIFYTQREGGSLSQDTLTESIGYGGSLKS